jgi:hypothetical protein
MKPGGHLAASLAVSAALYAFFRSPSISLWSLAGGTLIDIDHLHDYAVHPRRPACRDFDPRHFFDVMYNRRLERVFLLLHAWELAAALLVLGWAVPATGGWAIPLGFGMSVHILLDVFFNRIRVAAYSIVARGAHGFDRAFFYREEAGMGRLPERCGAARLAGEGSLFDPRHEAVQEGDHLLLVRRVDRDGGLDAVEPGYEERLFAARREGERLLVHGSVHRVCVPLSAVAPAPTRSDRRG